MNLKKIFIFGILAMIIGSCTTAKPSITVSRTQIKEVVTQQETTLVDVRIPNQFSAQTAPGAVNIPLAQLKEQLGFFRQQKSIVIFCNSGKQAGQAVSILKKNGIENVYNAKTLQNVIAIQKEINDN